MTAVQDPIVQRRRLRTELRRARDTAGLKQADVARAMGWSPSKFIRIERGDVSVSTNDPKTLLSHYEVKGKVRVNGLLELARSTRGVSFYDQFADLLKPGFKDYLGYETSASVTRQHHPVSISGLLQTEECGRAIHDQVVGFGPKAVNKAWAVRRHRQEVPERDDPIARYLDRYDQLEELALSANEIDAFLNKLIGKMLSSASPTTVSRSTDRSQPRRSNFIHGGPRSPAYLGILMKNLSASPTLPAEKEAG